MGRGVAKSWTDKERWALIHFVENATFLGGPLVSSNRITDAWEWHKQPLDSRFGRRLKSYSWRRQYLDSVRMLKSEPMQAAQQGEINCKLISRLAVVGRTDLIKALCDRATLE